MRVLLWIVLAAVALWLLLRSARPAAAAAGAPQQQTPPDVSPQAQLAAITPANPFVDVLDNITQGWATFEGGINPNSRNWRNNNPGNLKYAGWEGATGKDSGGFAQFADVGDGWDALKQYITGRATAHPEWDLFDLLNYALRGSTTGPTSDEQGNSDNEADFIASYAGIDPTQPVSSMLGIGS